jgi:hypothetical protein
MKSNLLINLLQLQAFLAVLPQSSTIAADTLVTYCCHNLPQLQPEINFGNVLSMINLAEAVMFSF